MKRGGGGEGGAFRPDVGYISYLALFPFIHLDIVFPCVYLSVLIFCYLRSMERHIVIYPYLLKWAKEGYLNFLCICATNGGDVYRC